MRQPQQIRSPRRTKRRSGQNQDALPRLGQAIVHRPRDGVVRHLFQRVRLAAQTRLQPPDQRQPAGRVRIGGQGQHGVQRSFSRHPPGGAAQGREHHDTGGRLGLAGLARRGDQGIGVNVVHARMFGVHQAGPDRIALHPLHDAVHHGDRLDRIVARGRLGRQHQGIGALIDGIGDIGGLGAGRRGRPRHRLQHLGRHDHRHAPVAGGADDGLLCHRHLFGIQLNAQITARHHHPVGIVEDGLQLVQRLGLLDLGQTGRLAVHQPLQLGHVLGLLDKAQRHPVHADPEGKGQILAVLGRQGRDRNDRFRHGDALAVRQFRAALDRHIGPVVRPLADAQPHPAIVQQQQHALAQGLEDFRMRHLHPRLVARLGVQVEPHGVARLDIDLDIAEPAQPQLGSLQVSQHAQRPLQRHLGPAYGLQRRRMVVMRTVAEVQAKDIHPGLGQGLDGAGRAAGGSDRGDDAGVSGSFHGSVRLEETLLCQARPPALRPPLPTKHEVTPGQKLKEVTMRKPYCASSL